MCGIAGIIGDFEIHQLDAMLLSQHHRGPDAIGKYSDGDFTALGHNRLAIIDLSSEANQPFLDSSGRYVLVFNGEIYNYIELKAELDGHYTFKTNSDTEVLLAAFIIYGNQCLQKLNGMFSFAIWDNQDKKLFAARDRFGVKPFFYSQKNKSFYFSSEIKAIHAAGILKIPNEKVWASYFAYGSYGNPGETFWEDILQLPGGHFLSFTFTLDKLGTGLIESGLRQAQSDIVPQVQSDLTIEKWYFFEEEVAKQPKNLTFEQAKEHYVTLLKDSIDLRFRADVPVGFNISGGLDSSVLLALVHNNNNNGSINAYTFYTNNPAYDELPWVEMMIAKTKNPLTKVLLQAHEVPDFAQKMEGQQDEPYGGIPTLAYAKIFEQAKKDDAPV